MVPPAETVTTLFDKCINLQKVLNLSAETVENAWSNFDTARTKYSLEGDMLHWLGCAIFVTSRTPKVNSNEAAASNHQNVSLTSLLRHCGLSLPQFFNKIKHWAEMENLGKDFERKIVNIQRSFEISGSTFREFQPMFHKVFQSPNDTDITSHRNRKQKFIPCTPSKVFDFCWLLYITIKGNCNDVVTAYNYLLVCCDLVFQNAFLDDRRDLLNLTFKGLPEAFRMQHTAPTTAPCIIECICTKGEILPDALYTKEYRSKKLFQPLFDSNILQGDSKTFTGIFQQDVFERNFKNITKAYEAYLLDKGDFDERIFLAEFKRQILLSSQQQANLGHDSILSDTGVLGITNVGLNATCPDTPLTNRRFLGPRDSSDPSAGLVQSQSALTAATHSVARLLAIVGGHATLMTHPPGPDEELQVIFAECAHNPQDNIIDILARMNEKFTTTYTGAFDDNVHLQIEKRLHFASTLFYKLLGNLLENEKSRRVDVSPLVQKEIFYECLYVCCIEIVMFSYNCQHKFPWILNALEISSFYFVRVIELIIRSKDQLPREIIKHLNYIEESILSSILWKSDSLIWEAIEKNEEIPKFEEIALPSHIVYNNSENNEKKASNNSTVATSSTPKSPGPSAVETFLSPGPSQNVILLASNNGNAVVKKQPFQTVKPGQSVLQSAKPNDASGSPNSQNNPENRPTNRPLKSGSLNIIFRKFYNLAGVRMEHLCGRVGIVDTALKLKIWTVLEHSVRMHQDLLRDRHLDHLLMCAVYVICKVTRNFENTKFTDIIRHYREQPQANSDIYRKVLISRRLETMDLNGILIVEEENMQDLINFYNNVYVQDMQTFALKFSSGSNHPNENLLLSPLPSVKTLMVSPRHQVAKNVYIKAYESPNNNILGRENKSSYVFNRSASKDLSNINQAINNGSARKRALANEFDMPGAFKKTRLPACVENLLNERKVQNA